MCDPKCHRRCINKGILWRNNKNSGVIPPDKTNLPHQIWAKQGFKKCKMVNLFLEKNMEK